MMPGEPFSPYPVARALIRRATRFRTTWITASLESLRARGHFIRYLQYLRPEHHDAVVLAVAGQWLDMSVARAHYEACNRLDLAVDEQMQMGATVGEGAQASVMATVVRTARMAGVTPWTALAKVDRLWRRGADGGAAAVWRLGPKEARAEFVGCELFGVPYFRHAYRGVLQGLLGLFCARGFVHEVEHGPFDAAYRLQWA